MADPEPAGLWGGRFAASVHPVIHRYTGSLHFDRRLARHDLIASLAHARVLWERGILSDAEALPILEGLSGILDDLEAGRLRVEGEDEDVHGWIERVLIERIGDAGRRLHTARSRNDQTAVALRLYVRASLARILERLAGLQRAWIEAASEHVDHWIPGYTHLQRGQPVSLAHHLLAHVWSLADDARRLRAAHAAAGTSPLGAGALAGSSFPLDPERAAALLGLPAVFRNSMHAVADRDYAVETAFACALLMVHLSRWADEVVLWSTREFGFAELGDEVAQGSSLMPQKKNPEAAELLRGKASRTIGSVTALLSLVKGLPLTYNSDLQEDKEPLFDALDTADASLEAAAAIAAGIRYRVDRMAAALEGGMVTATELADHLVRQGVPFRTAHARAGRAVRLAEKRGVELWELSLDELREVCPEAGDDVRDHLLPHRAVAAHDSPGGPAPVRVGEQIEAAATEVAALELWLSERGESPIQRARREGALAAKDLR